MKHNNLLALMLVSGFAFTSCQSPESKATVGKDSATMTTASSQEETARPSNDTSAASISMQSKVDDDESAFLKAAAVGGMMEVEAGKIALTNSKNPAVLAFAKQMITDHGKANAEVKTLAQKLEVLLPDAYPSEEKAHMEMMKEMKGAQFDQHYVDMMIKDHDKTVALFKSASSLESKEIGDFAKKTLPVIEAHYKQAQSIKN
jgi:putative membrane protein